MTCVATIANVVTSSEAVTIASTSSIVTQRPGPSSCLLFSTRTALQNTVPTPAATTRTGSDKGGFGSGEFWTNFDNGDERGTGGWGGRFKRARSTSLVPMMKRQTDVSCLSWVAVATPVTKPVTAYITSWATATSTIYDTRTIACDTVDQSPTETIGRRPTSSSDTGTSFTQVIPSVPSNEKAINSDLTMGSDSSTLSITESLTSDTDASVTSSTLAITAASVATADASSFSQLHSQVSSVSTVTQGTADQTALGVNVLQSSITGTVYSRTSLRASQSRSAPIDVSSTATALPNGDMSQRSHAGKIAGIIIGVLVAGAVVGLLFWAWLWKKKRAAKRDSRQLLTLRPSSPTRSEKSQYPESVTSYTDRPLLASRFSNSSSYHSRRQSLNLFARRWTGAWFRPMSGFGTPPPVPPIPPIPPLPQASRGMWERSEFPIDICDSDQAEADQSTGATGNPFGRIHPDFPEDWAPPGLTRPAGTRVTLTPAAGSDADLESTRTLSLSGLSATSRPQTPSSRASWQPTPLWREILNDNSPGASRTAF